jgi:hypothetical protein
VIASEKLGRVVRDETGRALFPFHQPPDAVPLLCHFCSPSRGTFVRQGRDDVMAALLSQFTLVSCFNAADNCMYTLAYLAPSRPPRPNHLAPSSIGGRTWSAGKSAVRRSRGLGGPNRDATRCDEMRRDATRCDEMRRGVRRPRVQPSTALTGHWTVRRAYF